MLEPKKIVLLPETTTYNSEDLLYIYQGGISKQISRENLFYGNELPELLVPTANDMLITENSSSGNRVAKKLAIDNLFNNIPADSLKVGNNQLVISNNKIGIGIVPVNPVDIYTRNTLTGMYLTNFNFNEVIEIDPQDANSVNTDYFGAHIKLSQFAGNTRKANSINGLAIEISDVYLNDTNSGIYGFNVTVTGTNPTCSIRPFISTVYNTNTNTSWMYAAEMYGKNMSYGGKTGSTPNLTSARIKAENISYAGGIGTTSITSLRGISMQITNTGVSSVPAMITSSALFEGSISNNSYATIVDSYGIKLNTPSNGGTITNHYGLYIADQTLSGTTLNYSIYVAGGESLFAGPVILKEISAPSGVSDGVKIFAQDNGSGKTRLMVQFGSGVAQQLAIEA